jgi:Tfp pilus assembly protein PilE
MTRGYSRAFTIVELIAVILVVGIITSISIVGYGEWQRSTLQTQVKSDLNGVAAAMESHKNFNEGYPSDASTVFTPSDGVLISGGSADGLTYCVDGAVSSRDDVEFYIAKPSGSNDPQEGTCATRPVPPVHEPLNLVANTVSHDTVSLTWDGVSNAESYKVESATNVDFSDATLAASPSGASVSVGSLTPSTTHFFRVKAVNPQGESGWSGPASATTQSQPLVAPTVELEVNSSSQITASWNAIVGADSYRVEVASNSTFTSGLQTFAGITGTSYEVTGLSQATTYWFKVYAINAHHESESNPASAATSSLSAPTMNVPVVNSVSQITLSWQPVSGATSYYLERATNSTFTTGVQVYSGITGTSRAVTGLTPATKYWFRVFATSSSGDSDSSNVRSATTQSVTAPTGVSVSLSGTAGAADYASTCASGGTKEYRYSTTHRTDGSTADNWGSWSAWSTNASNGDFITQGMYGRVLVEARCNFSGYLSSALYAKSAGEINQSKSGVSGTVSKPRTAFPGGYAQGTVTCPAGFARYVQLSLRTRSSGGGTAWSPSGNNRGLNVTNSNSGSSSGTTTARTYTAQASPYQTGSVGSVSDPNPTKGWPSNAHNWIGGHAATVLYRCTSNYITWRAVISSKTGSYLAPLNNSNITLGIQTITSRPAAESNLTSY